MRIKNKFQCSPPLVARKQKIIKGLERNKPNRERKSALTRFVHYPPPRKKRETFLPSPVSSDGEMHDAFSQSDFHFSLALVVLRTYDTITGSLT